MLRTSATESTPAASNFVWSELESRDESVELNMQLQMLAAGVVSVAEVRSMRGLPAVAE